MKIEVRRRWLFLYASLAIAFLLRHQPIALIVYVAFVVVGATICMILLPRKLEQAEHAFRADTLRCLTQRTFAELDRLADRQKLLKWFGPAHLLWETRGMAAAGQGDHEKAIGFFEKALKGAAPSHRDRIQLNLARELAGSGNLAGARSRYEDILKYDQGSAPAMAGLGLILHQEGVESTRAIQYLESALEIGIPRDLPVQLSLTELRIQSGDSRWRDALENARKSGATEAQLERLSLMAQDPRTQSDA